MGKKKIQGNWGVLLSYVGKLYGNPSNAIKEYISNALDEWMKAKERGDVDGPCKVVYSLEKDRITIDYNSPGMDEKEFKNALNRVAESIKVGSKVPQIGQLGIGIFAFNQVGSTCAFYSKKAHGKPTIKVVLMSNSDEYEIDTAIKRESRQDPGMTVVITRLHQDPTKPRGSLAPHLLQRAFAEKFHSYLAQGILKTEINCNGKVYEVKPLDIILPKVGEAFKEVHLYSDWQKKFNCQFWFDPSGKSRVSIRHTGVSIIEDMKNYPSYGLENSIYASGFLKGYIDADFLKPLPARTSFEENDDWLHFVVELEKMMPSVEDEVEELRRKEEEKKLTEVQKQALKVAREILDQDQFKDLELLAGLRRRRSPATHHRTQKTGRKTGGRSTTAGEHPGGLRIAYEEKQFEEGPAKHSRFVSGIVQANELNPDFRQDIDYGALMIGKEAIAYNDTSGAADYYLEKLLSFLFQVESRTQGGSARQVGLIKPKEAKRPRGQPRKHKSRKSPQLKLTLS